MNEVILSGRFVRDPELRQTKTDKAVTRFTLAVDNGYGDKKKNVFIPCEAWSGTAEFVGKYFQKGDPIEVVGFLADNSYEKDGKKVYGMKVTVREAKFCMGKTNVVNARDIEPGGQFSELLDDDGGQLPF